MNVDKIKTKFSIAIFRPTDKKWKSKTLFLVIFDSHSSIVKSVFDRRISGVLMNIFRFSLTKLLSQLDFLRLTVLDQISQWNLL